MPFYKRDGNELLAAPTFVRGSDFELLVEFKDQHSYPVDGWYWFDNLDAALTGLAPVPAGVSPRQIRMAMTRTPYMTGTLRDAVEYAVANGGTDLKDWWNYSTVFERGNPQVAAMAEALGVSGPDIDALWALANTL